jgi:predicted nuclease of predicted toxin-antitoxin system
MRAKLDESMPNEAAGLLRGAGWECHTVHDEGLGGADDARLASVCRDEDRVLFTLDLDFADIRAYPPVDYLGIVVFRPEKPSRDAVLGLLERALPVLSNEWATNQLWIVEPSRIRTRASPQTTA